MTDFRSRPSSEPMEPETPDQIDVELLNRVIDGDRDALRRLYLNYYDRLLRFMLRITYRLDLAEEGVNDVMLVVWQNGRSFRGNSTVSTWIFGIAYRTALKLAEKSRRHSSRTVSMENENFHEPATPNEEHINEERCDWLDAGLCRLSAEHRAVIELTYYHGYSYEQIAGIMDCPINTVKTRMFYARARLRKILPRLGDDDKSIERVNL